MAQANPAINNAPAEMVTGLEEILRTNCASAWMAEIENTDPEVVR